MLKRTNSMAAPKALATFCFYQHAALEAHTVRRAEFFSKGPLVDVDVAHHIWPSGTFR